MMISIIQVLDPEYSKDLRSLLISHGPFQTLSSLCWHLCLSTASAPHAYSLHSSFLVSCGTFFQGPYLLLTPSVLVFLSSECQSHLMAQLTTQKRTRAILMNGPPQDQVSPSWSMSYKRTGGKSTYGASTTVPSKAP